MNFGWRSITNTIAAFASVGSNIVDLIFGQIGKFIRVSKNRLNLGNDGTCDD